MSSGMANVTISGVHGGMKKRRTVIQIATEMKATVIREAATACTKMFHTKPEQIQSWAGPGYAPALPAAAEQ
jgi:hypothetical protein